MDFTLLPQEVALDFIGKRGPRVGVSREQRIQFARELLQKEFLPHVAIDRFGFHLLLFAMIIMDGVQT